jgi:uncharacterized tellurite resistance protein B-like protein
MINKKTVDSWQAGHFIAYLYLAVADADSETTIEEINMARKKVKKLLDTYYKNSGLNHDSIVEEVLSEIANHSDSEKTDLINEFNKKFKLDEDCKVDIVSDLTDIIESDDKVQAAEHYMLSFIRAVMSKN